MANLNKLLVHVPLALCEGFKKKYVKDTDRRDRSYDNKVVFLEDTQEIFTQGKLYGTNVTDFNELKTKVGTIPADAVSNNIVDYISELISKADYIKSVKKKDTEKFIAADTDENNNVTIYSTTKLDTAVFNANNAIKELDLLGYKLDKNNKIITVSDAQTALKLGDAAYKNSSYFATPHDVEEAKSYVIGKKDIDNETAYTIHGTRAYASYVASKAAQSVVNILPEVKKGSGIEVTQSTVNGKTIYTVSTSAEVFHYRGNKTTLEQLPASDNTTGDVWSVGPADAEGSTLYTWDGDEWINIGGPNGVTDVDKTESHGVKLDKNPDGTVKVIVGPVLGEVKDGNDKVITGGTAYTAIFNAKKDCNSYMLGYIGGLENSYTSKNSAYVNVRVDTTGGNVSYVAVSETKKLTDAIAYANTAMQSATILGYLVKNGGEVTVDQVKNKLGLGSAAYEEISYFDKAGTAQKLIDGLSRSASGTDTFVTVNVETSKGNVSKVTVTESDTLKNAINGGIQTINGDLPYLKADRQGSTVNLDLDETEVFNYVSSNIWETYSA